MWILSIIPSSLSPVPQGHFVLLSETPGEICVRVTEAHHVHVLWLTGQKYFAFCILW